MGIFVDWVKSREPGPKCSQADLVLKLILQSGQGISRGTLGAAIKLERESLDAVIQALVDTGQVVVSLEGEQRVYRAR